MTRLGTVVGFLILVATFGAACGGEPVGRSCFIPGGPRQSGEGCDDTVATMQCAAGLRCEPTGATGELKCQPTLENIIASPALECQSRTCLHIGGQPTGTDECTAECGSNDDCEKVPESDCMGGFVCAVAVEVGPFCCKKFCQCVDFLTFPDPESKDLPPPAACSADNPINECCNLSGRRDDTDEARAMYPQCHNIQ